MSLSGIYKQARRQSEVLPVELVQWPCTQWIKALTTAYSEHLILWAIRRFLSNCEEQFSSSYQFLLRCFCMLQSLNTPQAILFINIWWPFSLLGPGCVRYWLHCIDSYRQGFCILVFSNDNKKHQNIACEYSLFLRVLSSILIQFCEEN